MDDKKVVRAVADAKLDAQDEFTLSSGVVLRAVKASPVTLIKVMTRFPRPKPPTYYMESMGREMENPDDPDYIERVKAWDNESSSLVVDALILLGTELVSVPKGVEGPTGKKWLNKYKLLGMPSLPEDKDWCYLNWVTMVAAPSDKDITILQEVVGRKMGIAEADVKSAETFPGRDS